MDRRRRTHRNTVSSRRSKRRSGGRFAGPHTIWGAGRPLRPRRFAPQAPPPPAAGEGTQKRGSCLCRRRPSCALPRPKGGGGERRRRSRSEGYRAPLRPPEGSSPVRPRTLLPPRIACSVPRATRLSVSCGRVGRPLPNARQGAASPDAFGAGSAAVACFCIPLGSALSFGRPCRTSVAKRRGREQPARSAVLAGPRHPSGPDRATLLPHAIFRHCFSS